MEEWGFRLCCTSQRLYTKVTFLVSELFTVIYVSIWRICILLVPTPLSLSLDYFRADYYFFTDTSSSKKNAYMIKFTLESSSRAVALSLPNTVTLEYSLILW